MCVRPHARRRRSVSPIGPHSDSSRITSSGSVIRPTHTPPSQAPTAYGGIGSGASGSCSGAAHRTASVEVSKLAAISAVLRIVAPDAARSAGSESRSVSH